jgi:hypothetical protein
MSDNAKRALQDFQAPAKVKLALLWTSLMFLYIYNDYFSLYLPGTVERMAEGRMGPLGEATALVLVAVSTLLAIPALMIFLSVSLPPAASRWLNILFGVVYTVIEALTLSRSALFYRTVVVLEIALTLLIVWYALRWPRPASPE